MGKLGQAIQTLVKMLVPGRYSWPATDISLNGSHFHLVGSIHMGTRDMQPLPPALLQKLRQADALIVEADITCGISPFGHSAPCDPLPRRLNAQRWQQLSKLCGELGIDTQVIASLPAWQVALMLQAQQAQQLGLRAEYGIDYQLLSAAHGGGQRVIELEGPQAQLHLLEALPENGQSLLEDTLLHWHTNARLLQTMISWWLDVAPGRPESPLPSTFSNDLHDLLMDQRNARWNSRLRTLPPGDYVVAVGALHLYGQHNLVDLLRKR
ncbi:conjugal transfer protein TraB [Erwinia sp. OLTSP20]|uniref:TraB/GumN family protein n=1 Tax=unclassified Erwinia TaxID=2622719 RepID=UPI000C19F4CB|nr:MULTISPECIES: TraB/GumN family protein [unclassified Erwinia]PIJ50630.1 conjugal transfer protein TraB [Erwinia sp. OAMSP11]PIJ72676.1 conjugal transfer protein TraB [Erwinia sp. OLSSP12]PIJ83241.1 conjugal transfer protein TraB [Erwinia sp. OLCASP19]PIJ85257.1 conjugal transfer protein TraB [Erwinia sp. OLMTSP26]PIJ87259.1 conjugal transfer protein TraB [Erwinia sp. OLMDSP33]